MLKGQTLVVVGAGASSEIGLPTGHALKANIAKLLDIRFEDGYRMSSGDHRICDALTAHVQGSGGRDINPHLHAAWRIRNAMPQAISIDNFIDCHQDDDKITLCGKLGIVRGILDAERTCSLHVDRHEERRHPNFSALGETWYAALMQLLTQNCQLSGLPDRLSRVTFVIFNYDRCIEHFLFHSLQNYYDINESQAANVLKHLTVYHPYGSVGLLPWQGMTQRVEFGGDASGNNLLQLAAGIKTFTEGTDPESSDIQAIHAKITGASTVLFLGFAYHAMNLNLLQTKPHPKPTSVRYFGTAFGMSNNDVELVVEDLVQIASIASGRISIRNDLTCAKFFREYWRSLSIA